MPISMYKIGLLLMKNGLLLEVQELVLILHMLHGSNSLIRNVFSIKCNLLLKQIIIIQLIIVSKYFGFYL
jgi:hypothetical protein